MTRDTRFGTDPAKTAKILAGLRDRIGRLEKRDQHADETAQQLHVESESATTVDRVIIERGEVAPDSGFGETPFGESFGDPGDEQDEELPDPEVVREVTNTTCVGWHEYVAEATQVTGEYPVQPSHIALGDGTGDFVVANTALHDRFGTVELHNSTVLAGDPVASLHAEIDSGQFVGETIRELGVIDETTGRLFNHAPIEPGLEKDDATTFAIEVQLGVTES